MAAEKDFHRWFQELALAERRVACAVVDDPVFVEFFVRLAKGNKGDSTCNFFSRENLVNRFEFARDDVKIAASLCRKLTSNKISDDTFLDDGAGYLGPCSGNPTTGGILDDYGDPFSSVSALINLSGIADRGLIGSDSEFATGESFLRCLTVSYVTATSSSDALYVSDRYLRDPAYFFETLRILSRGGSSFLHAACPTLADCRAMIAGKRLPELSWLFSQFSTGKTYAVPSYAVLAARIEISMWIAFYSSCTSTRTIVGVCKTNDTKTSASSRKISSPKEVDANNSDSDSVDSSLRTLEQSRLRELPACSAMMAIGCMAEELRLVWHRLVEHDKLQLLALSPSLKRFCGRVLGGENAATSSAAPSTNYNSITTKAIVVDLLLVPPIELLCNDDEEEGGHDDGGFDGCGGASVKSLRTVLQLLLQMQQQQQTYSNGPRGSGSGSKSAGLARRPATATATAAPRSDYSFLLSGPRLPSSAMTTISSGGAMTMYDKRAEQALSHTQHTLTPISHFHTSALSTSNNVIVHSEDHCGSFTPSSHSDQYQRNQQQYHSAAPTTSIQRTAVPQPSSLRAGADRATTVLTRRKGGGVKNKEAAAAVEMRLEELSLSAASSSVIVGGRRGSSSDDHCLGVCESAHVLPCGNSSTNGGSTSSQHLTVTDEPAAARCSYEARLLPVSKAEGTVTATTATTTATATNHASAPVVTAATTVAKVTAQQEKEKGRRCCPPAHKELPMEAREEGVEHEEDDEATSTSTWFSESGWTSPPPIINISIVTKSKKKRLKKQQQQKVAAAASSTTVAGYGYGDGNTATSDSHSHIREDDAGGDATTSSIVDEIANTVTDAANKDDDVTAAKGGYARPSTISEDAVAVAGDADGSSNISEQSSNRESKGSSSSSVVVQQQQQQYDDDVSIKELNIGLQVVSSPPPLLDVQTEKEGDKEGEKEGEEDCRDNGNEESTKEELQDRDQGKDSSHYSDNSSSCNSNSLSSRAASGGGDDYHTVHTQLTNIDGGTPHILPAEEEAERVGMAEKKEGVEKRFPVIVPDTAVTASLMCTDEPFVSTTTSTSNINKDSEEKGAGGEGEEAAQKILSGSIPGGRLKNESPTTTSSGTYDRQRHSLSYGDNTVTTAANSAATEDNGGAGSIVSAPSLSSVAALLSAVVGEEGICSDTKHYAATSTIAGTSKELDSNESACYRHDKSKSGSSSCVGGDDICEEQSSDGIHYDNDYRHNKDSRISSDRSKVEADHHQQHQQHQQQWVFQPAPSAALVMMARKDEQEEEEGLFPAAQDKYRANSNISHNSNSASISASSIATTYNHHTYTAATHTSSMNNDATYQYNNKKNHRELLSSRSASTGAAASVMNINNGRYYDDGYYVYDDDDNDRGVFNKLTARLNKNIMNFNKLMNSQMEAHRLVQVALNLELRSMVEALWPNALVRVYGSSVTGLALPSSDIDIVVQLIPTPSTSTREARPMSMSMSQSAPPHVRPTRSIPRDAKEKEEHSSAISRADGNDSAPGTSTSISILGATVIHHQAERARVTTATATATAATTLSHSINSDSAHTSDCDDYDCDLEYGTDAPVDHIHNSDADARLTTTTHRPLAAAAAPMTTTQIAPGPASESFNGIFFALTGQLYMQPWASGVNPIPTAAVPVIKLQVAADVLLSSPVLQMAVTTVHQQYAMMIDPPRSISAVDELQKEALAQAKSWVAHCQAQEQMRQIQWQEQWQMHVLQQQQQRELQLQLQLQRQHSIDEINAVAAAATSLSLFADVAVQCNGWDDDLLPAATTASHQRLLTSTDGVCLIGSAYPATATATAVTIGMRPPLRQRSQSDPSDTTTTTAAAAAATPFRDHYPLKSNTTVTTAGTTTSSLVANHSSNDADAGSGHMGMGEQQAVDSISIPILGIADENGGNGYDDEVYLPANANGDAIVITPTTNLANSHIEPQPQQQQQLCECEHIVGMEAGPSCSDIRSSIISVCAASLEQQKDEFNSIASVVHRPTTMTAVQHSPMDSQRDDYSTYRASTNTAGAPLVTAPPPLPLYQPYLLPQAAAAAAASPSYSTPCSFPADLHMQEPQQYAQQALPPPPAAAALAAVSVSLLPNTAAAPSPFTAAAGATLYSFQPHPQSFIPPTGLGLHGDVGLMSGFPSSSGPSPMSTPLHGDVGLMSGFPSSSSGLLPTPIPIPIPTYPLQLAGGRLPFHTTSGVSVAVDISIESGIHKGIPSCEFIQQALQKRTPEVASVIKTVKGLLRSVGLNVPFTGGLSSYTISLLVMACYDMIVSGEHRLCVRRGQMRPSNQYQTMFGPHRHHATLIVYACSSSNSSSSRSSRSQHMHNASSDPAPPSLQQRVFVSAAEIFLMFLYIFAREFDPSCQGIDICAADSRDVKKKSTIVFPLSPEQRVAVGTSCWVSDPIDPWRNVARPSFSFRQVQGFLEQCLETIEREGVRVVGNKKNIHLDLLRSLMEY